MTERTAGVFADESYWKEEEARRVLAAARRSGRSLAGYAREIGVRPRRLYWWKARLASPAARRPAPVPRFVPVTVREAPRPERAIVVTLGREVRVEVHELSAASAAWVAALAAERERR